MFFALFAVCVRPNGVRAAGAATLTVGGAGPCGVLTGEPWLTANAAIWYNDGRKVKKHMKEAEDFTFSSRPTKGSVMHEEAFGAIEPKDLPWQLVWPSAWCDPLGERGDTCVEYGKLLMECVRRKRPVTVKEYVDFFWKDADGTYRNAHSIESRDVDEFIRKSAAQDYLL
mgnify:FL=1